MSSEGVVTDECTSAGNPVSFEITSTRIVQKEADDNKHVVYILQVRHVSGKEDINPVTIERRYTHFHNLYTILKQEHPTLLSNVSFPRKVLTGNFDEKLISARSTGFESLLKVIGSEFRLLNDPAVLSFLQDIELKEAKDYMKEKRFDLAAPLLENNFRILNKIYTDRSRCVLLALCRLLGCCAAMPGAPNANKWAELARYRYEGVSDSELLSLYVPLLHLSIRLCRQHDKCTKYLDDCLESLRRQGIPVTDNTSLIEAVTRLEQT